MIALAGHAVVDHHHVSFAQLLRGGTAVRERGPLAELHADVTAIAEALKG